MGAAVFVLQNVHPSQDRYLTPVLPAALALLLVSFAEAVSLLRRRIPSGLVALVFGGLALSATVFLLRQARGVVEGLLLEPDPRAPLRTIAEEGYTVCHAGYDTAYTLQFLSDERVRFIPYHSPDRNRTLSAELRAIPGRSVSSRTTEWSGDGCLPTPRRREARRGAVPRGVEALRR